MESKTFFLASLSMFLSSFLISSEAYDFYVGGRDGWVVKPSESYDRWARRLRFQVNDTLVFKYKGGSDSVLVVSRQNFDTCSNINPVVKLDGGDSRYKLGNSGPFFFITGNQTNCQNGQKLVLIVLFPRTKKAPVPPPPATPPSTAPASPPSAAPATPPSNPPAPASPPGTAPATPPSTAPAPATPPSTAPASPPSTAPATPPSSPPAPATPPSSSTPVSAPPPVEASPPSGGTPSDGSAAPSGQSPPPPKPSSSTMLTSSMVFTLGCSLLLTMARTGIF